MESTDKYLQQLESTLDLQRELLARLEKRVEMLSLNDEQSPYEENENQIIIIRTNAEIGSLKHIIQEKHDYFVKYSQSVGKEALELDDKFEGVWKKANNKAKSNDAIKKIIQNLDIEKTKQNKESKLYVYNKLVSLLND
jgi:hypothetical protein